MIGTMTLTDFLLARIAEDEAAARAAIRHTRDGDTGHWEYDGEGVTGGRMASAVAVGPWGGGLSDEGPHIARHDPARVLAECEAKRQIVEDFEILHRDYRETHADSTEARRFQAVVAMARLASVYADHPDYREEWRPDG